MKFVSFNDLDAAFDEVRSLAERSKPAVKVALVGGYALARIGSPRLTGDLDVIASGPIQGLRAKATLFFGGYQSKTSNGVDVDVILRDDKASKLYQAALVHARNGENVTPEYLVAMKMVSGRDRDNLDLLFLLGSGAADLQKTKKIVEKHLGWYGAQELESMIEEAKWKTKLEKKKKGTR